MEELSTKFEILVGLAIEYGPKIIGVILIFFAALIVGGIAKKAVQRSLARTKFDPTLTAFFANSAKYLILTVAVIGCLGVFGIETTSFAAVIGAVGLAIGLAFQGTLGNVAAGVMLLIFRPFKIGDFISAAGVSGSVQEITLFTTELNTPSNEHVIVPNSKLFNDNITNYSFNLTRRVEIGVGCEYSADIDETRRVLEKSIESVADVLKEPAPQVFLSALGASSVDWKVRVWVKSADYWKVHEQVTRAVKMALDNAKIGIPFPQMDIHFDQELFTSRPVKPSEARA